MFFGNAMYLEQQILLLEISYPILQPQSAFSQIVYTLSQLPQLNHMALIFLHAARISSLNLHYQLLFLINLFLELNVFPSHAVNLLNLFLQLLAFPTHAANLLVELLSVMIDGLISVIDAKEPLVVLKLTTQGLKFSKQFIPLLIVVQLIFLVVFLHFHYLSLVLPYPLLLVFNDLEVLHFFQPLMLLHPNLPLLQLSRTGQASDFSCQAFYLRLELLFMAELSLVSGCQQSALGDSYIVFLKEVHQLYIDTAVITALLLHLLHLVRLILQFLDQLLILYLHFEQASLESFAFLDKLYLSHAFGIHLVNLCLFLELLYSDSVLSILFCKFKNLLAFPIGLLRGFLQGSLKLGQSFAVGLNLLDAARQLAIFLLILYLKLFQTLSQHQALFMRLFPSPTNHLFR